MITTSTRRRQLIGTVVSDRQTKTVVVRVDRTKTHPRYQKQYRASTKLSAHDEQGQYHVGDRVVIEETRPLSRHKRWRVIGRVGHGQESA